MEREEEEETSPPFNPVLHPPLFLSHIFPLRHPSPPSNRIRPPPPSQSCRIRMPTLIHLQVVCQMILLYLLTDRLDHLPPYDFQKTQEGLVPGAGRLGSKQGRGLRFPLGN